MSIAQPYGIVTFDEQVTLFELSTIGGINLPAAAIDSELELAAGIKINAMADLQPGGTRFAQEGLIEELKVALEAADAVIDAIERMDVDKIPPEKAELLRNDFLPTDEELKAIKERTDNGQKIAPLDSLLLKLSGVSDSLPWYEVH